MHFSVISPDLHSRICKTYFEAITQRKSLNVAYGGVAGINALGSPVVRSLLLSNLPSLTDLVNSYNDTLKGVGCEIYEQEKKHELRLSVEMLREIVRQTLGTNNSPFDLHY